MATYGELKEAVGFLSGELHAMQQPHIAYMRAFQAWDSMVMRVEGQKESERKQWWMDRLNRMKALFVHFDTMNGERNRLQIALDQSREQVNACLKKIEELEKENELLRKELLS